MLPLVVFSHLRWDFVYQRPQHLLSRFAADRPVLFIEEPVFDEREPFAEMLSVDLANGARGPGGAPASKVRVLRPHTPIRAGGFHDDQLPVMRRLVREAVASEGFTEYCVWFYTPMALPLMQGLHPRAIVYDCMDELRAFRNAPRQLIQRESALLKVANVVFTGGPSLYAAKRDRHPNVHAFPSSVDLAHFAQARDRSLEHPLLASVPHPRLGFFGVLDERLDQDIVAHLGETRPDWHVCLVGPVVKIDPASLPRHPNIHYFPQQSYDNLPRFLAGWDVCLMPFARNESTQFISPTKTLEYMAAHLPIVSTPITDVIALYRDAVAIADTPQAFVEACERALAQTGSERAQRIAAMDRLTRSTSWDRTARAMSDLVEAAEREGLNASARLMLDPGQQRAARKSAECVILGAGPTGLSAAYHYGAQSLLLERNGRVGGWCRSLSDKGFTFDYAGHIMFSNDPYVLDLYRILLGDNVHWQDREAWVYSKGAFTRYPFQGSLYGLPPQVLKECLIGAIEARFGPLKGAPGSGGAAGSEASPNAATALKLKPALACDPKDAVDCCADGVAELPSSRRMAEAAAPQPPRNFEEFIYRVWGAGVAKHFAIPYNRKLWTVPLSEMETSWLGGRVPLPDLEEMIEGALSPAPKPMGPNARFGYPLRGGFQAMMDGFLPLLRGELELNAEVTAVSPSTRTVTLADGRSFEYDVLISTLPLPELIRAIGDEAPVEIRNAARELKHVSVRCVNLGVGRSHLTEKHWIYYPEDTVFHRIFVQGNASPYCNPPGGFGLTCEITYSPTKPLPCDGEALIQRCIDDCRRVGIMRPDDPVITANQVDMKYAYVIYDHMRTHHVQRIRTWLEQRQILLAGRYSEWEYYNSDHAFLAGKKAAESAHAIVATAQAKTA
ncbi:MAG TPA: FAD-dependent oxidoreductase [Casimicrobiaceae bacterium]|nr:FAD-dependent oxidoreductase [Casimicrobiaceae bacterium]